MITIAIAGHVNHGKTSLTKAISNFDTDRLKAEQARGISIELGFAFVSLGDKELALVDMPGHSDFTRSMIKGAVGTDSAIIVFDSTSDKIMPQTLEHAFILKSIGVSKIIAVVTKIDKSETKNVEIKLKEINLFLKKFGFTDITTAAISIFDEKSVDNLKKILSELNYQPKTNPSKHFRMFIEKSFIIKGSGVIARGTILSGKIKKSDEIFIYPINKFAKIKKIEKAGMEISSCAASRVALNLSGVELKDIPSGSIVYEHGAFTENKKFIVEIDYFDNAKLKNNGEYNLFVGTAKTRGRIILTKSQINLKNAMPLIEGDVIFIRAGEQEKTVAACKIKQILTECDTKKENKKIKIKKTNANIDENQIENVYKTIEEEKFTTLAALREKLGLEEIIVAKIINILINREKIVSLGNYIASKSFFSRQVELIKEVISENKFADIKTAKEKTKIGRNILSEILDKGDRLSVWKNIDGKRYLK